MIISLETTTSICSVALHLEGKLLSLTEFHLEKSHSSVLAKSIQYLIQNSGCAFSNLKAVTISKGPGSYTGLRIGSSTAKGLSYSLEIPLIAVDTLKAIALASKHCLVENELVCPMMDAKRMEVYAALYDYNLEEIEAVKQIEIDENSFDKVLSNNRVYFVGNGANKASTVLNHQKARFNDQLYPSAREIGFLAYNKYLRCDFENVAYFEPVYLKNFHIEKIKPSLKYV